MKISIKMNYEKNFEFKDIHVGDNISIGRSSKNIWKIKDPKVSAYHCNLTFLKDKLQVFDLNSKNGLYLNGIKIEYSDLFAGDHIKIGDTIFSIDENNSDKEIIKKLTFPGPHQERIYRKLTENFTGIRLQNQKDHSNDSNWKNQEAKCHSEEVELRKKVKSKIKLSKEEIRIRKKTRAGIADSIDALFSLCLLLSIFISFKDDDSFFELANFKIYFKYLFPVSGALCFMLINYKSMKFTLGERITGIKKIYLNQ